MNLNLFEKGDLVECIEPGSLNLKQGEIYTIRKIGRTYNGDAIIYLHEVRNEAHSLHYKDGYMSDRFKKIGVNINSTTNIGDIKNIIKL